MTFVCRNRKGTICIVAWKGREQVFGRLETLILRDLPSPFLGKSSHSHATSLLLIVRCPFHCCLCCHLPRLAVFGASTSSFSATRQVVASLSLPSAKSPEVVSSDTLQGFAHAADREASHKGDRIVTQDCEHSIN
eukprot:6188250-Pleurochrysis_carterae.AAC.2